MQFFDEVIKTITKNEIENYFIDENHSWKECLNHFKISHYLFVKLIKYYEIKKPKEKSVERVANSKLKKYGSSTYNNRSKAKQTCLERYGVENPFQDIEKIKNSYLNTLGVDHPMHKEDIKNKSLGNRNGAEIMQKCIQTYYEQTGFTNPAKNPLVVKKGIQTKIENGVFDSPGTSNIERRLEKILTRKFGKVIHHYRDERYARKSGYKFECDFYIPELDLFIELNAAYYHHDCPFDETNQKHLELRDKLKNSTKSWENSKYKDWCIRDTEKLRIAKENSLNYIQLYPTNTIYNNQQFNNKKYSDLISYLIKKLNNKK